MDLLPTLHDGRSVDFAPGGRDISIDDEAEARAGRIAAEEDDTLARRLADVGSRDGVDILAEWVHLGWRGWTCSGGKRVYFEKLDFNEGGR